MELTAFKNTPEELIRHIMGYARPTYPYLVELKLAKKDAERYGVPLTHYPTTITHKSTFRNYRIYRDYVRNYGGEWGGEYYEVMRELQEEWGEEEEEEEVKVGTILRGFERGNFYSYIVACLDDYEGVALVTSLQPRSWGCIDRITIQLRNIKNNCFDIGEQVLWDWDDGSVTEWLKDNQ